VFLNNDIFRVIFVKIQRCCFFVVVVTAVVTMELIGHWPVEMWKSCKLLYVV